jgi:aconitate hydratase
MQNLPRCVAKWLCILSYCKNSRHIIGNFSLLLRFSLLDFGLRNSCIAFFPALKCKTWVYNFAYLQKARFIACTILRALSAMIIVPQYGSGKEDGASGGLCAGRRMIERTEQPVVWKNGAPQEADHLLLAEGIRKTIAYRILQAHNEGSSEDLKIRFDALLSHDITYVGIIQTAIASGIKAFPVPYALTNCHNSLCAVGGTINEDDHRFGLSAAKKFGGIYVPANMAVCHQYAREQLAGAGRMILGSDSHTRYGPLGTMGIGEGGPELVKQLLGGTYDIRRPEVVLVYLTGKPAQGVGPHDVALALCAEVYKDGFVKNRVLEFAGPGIADLSMDFRFGIDVMTTETACLSSVWATDETVKTYYSSHNRSELYHPLGPEDGAVYDRMIHIDLSSIEPMIALPFHPSEAYPIREFLENPGDILRACEQRAQEVFGPDLPLRLTDKFRNGKFTADQGIIAGCSGGMYENIAEAAAILRSRSLDSGPFALSVYPSSLPVSLSLMKSGVTAALLEAGAVVKPCFCGPCFGAGDVPSNGSLSLRHTTRNFPNREGSIPKEGQLAAVALMDSRSIAATAAMGGILTPATSLDYVSPAPEEPSFDAKPYERRVYFGWGKAQPHQELIYGPNIRPWPSIPAMPEDLVMELASVIHDPVTTTDELIPSGETSSFRSNPLRLAEFALSRRDPDYVRRTKDIRARGFASCIFAECPGDGSAREQAASCQRVLGGAANICRKFATKRYRSNCINWGMLPLVLDPEVPFDYKPGDRVEIPGVRKAILSGADTLRGTIAGKPVTFTIGPLTQEERQILLDGCLMNYYASREASCE